MEAIKELNQVMNAATLKAAPVKTVDEITNDTNVLNLGVYNLDGTNNKARELNTPSGYVLISYNSKVELLSRELVHDELLNVEFISKLYNSYSTTTAKHQSKFRYENIIDMYNTIQIFLKDETAQVLFNAACTNLEAAREIKKAAIKQYEREVSIINYLNWWKDTFKSSETPAGEILTWFMNGANKNLNLELITESIEELKTVTNKYYLFESDNIRFKIKVSYNKNCSSIKAARIQEVNPTYNSVLID